MKYEYLISFLYKGKDKKLTSGMLLTTRYDKINSIEKVAETRDELQKANKNDIRKGTNLIIINIQLLRSVKEDGDKK